MSVVADDTQAISLSRNADLPSKEMACNTMLPDFQPQDRGTLHNNVAMMKEKYCSPVAAEKHNEDSAADTGDESNICVDSRSSSPSPFNNGHDEKLSENIAPPPSSNGLDSLNMDEYAAAFARHRLALLRGESVPPETSKLLRGMLQGKEKQLQEKIMEMHKTGLPVAEDSALINKLLQGNNDNMIDFRAKPTFDGDTESLNSRSLTPQDISDDSDTEAKDFNRLADKVIIELYRICRRNYIQLLLS